MKTLLLMRHAKSSWKDEKIDDKERPLNKRGRRDAPRMGRLLVEHELVPQRILSSSAARARQTAELLTGAFDRPVEVIYLDSLFMADGDEYFAALRTLPEDIERVMVIAHNPSLEMLLQMLGGQIESLPTAVVAHLVLNIRQWGDLSDETSGEIVAIWRPKDVLEEDEKADKKSKERKKKDK